MAASSLSSPGERSKLLCNNIFTLSEELALTRDIFILNADNQNKLNERLSFGDFEDMVNESMGNLSSRSNLNSLARTQENKKLLKKHKLRHSRVNIVNVGAQKVHKSAYDTAHLHYLKERSGKDNVLLKNWEEQCSFLRTMLETVKQNHLLPPSPILDFEDRDPSPIGSPSSDRGPSPERGPSPSPSRSPSPLRNKKLTSSMVYSESDSEDEYSSKKGRVNEKAEEIPVSVDKKTSSKNKNELNKHILMSTLHLIVFLDAAKQQHVIDSTLLFLRKSSVKSSRAVLNVICRDYISGIGNLFKHLSHLQINVSHEQCPFEELEFSVGDLQ